MEKSKIRLLSLLMVVVIVSLSGCVRQPPEERRAVVRDVITIPAKISTPQGDVPAYTVSPSDPLAGTTAELSFFIVNKGEKRIDEVEVNFFDVPGLSLESLECEGPSKQTDNYCILSDMERKEYRKVVATFLAPDVSSQTPFTISFYVYYNYSGTRLANIPIIDGETVLRPEEPYTPSDPSDGPIEFEFELEAKGERIVGKKKVKEYWAVKEKPFKVKMKLKHVGSISLGQVHPITIERNNLKVKMGKLDTVKNFCPDFEKNGNLLTLNRNITVKPSESIELICYFTSTEDFEGWITGTLEASFEYEYKFIRTETFTVRPPLEE